MGLVRVVAAVVLVVALDRCIDALVARLAAELVEPAAGAVRGTPVLVLPCPTVYVAGDRRDYDYKASQKNGRRNEMLKRPQQQIYTGRSRSCNPIQMSIRLI